MDRLLKRVLPLLAVLVLLTGCSAQPAPVPEQTAAPTVEAVPSPVSTSLAVSTQPIARKSEVGFYFNTVVTITLSQSDDQLFSEIWALCDRYEKLLSKTEEGSDVDRLNKAEGERIKLDPETMLILRKAKEVNQLTGGAYSITIAPITALWDFTGGTDRMPSEKELETNLPLVDDSKLILYDDDTACLPAGMEIDLGGIAKGYIADQVAALVRGRCDYTLLNFGGNVYCTGQKPDGSPFSIGVQDPKNSTGTAIAAIKTGDISTVTSGIYERCFEKDGVFYHHILDPKTGMSAESDLSSVTIISESSMTADALATACVVIGSERTLALLEELGADALLITRDEKIMTTEGFTAKYPLVPIDERFDWNNIR